MVSVLMSISIYWLYLILEGKKTEEVRKHFPKAKLWNKKVLLYATQSKRELMRIPKAHREKYSKLMGKVVGEFVCDRIRKGKADNLLQAYYHNNPSETQLTDLELVEYANTGKPVYFLHISDLKMYDTPKKLNEFYKVGKRDACVNGNRTCYYAQEDFCRECNYSIKHPPQSWGYVEAV